jgi:hypothetical protein
MDDSNINKDYHKEFVSLLEKMYGSFNSDKKSFESTSNSKIARDLCYSDSQFSRLINNTASEGEFKRALRNVNRLLKERSIDEYHDSILSSQKPKSNKIILLSILTFVILILLFQVFYWGGFASEKVAVTIEDKSRYDMLKWSFENKYIKPYVKLKELPVDCNYPCYKYQGKWVLKNEYKIPFFRERNGFHYVAKDVTMYVRCIEENDDSGTSFEGYEYQRHEIWYDIREMPIDSFLVNGDRTKVREDYNSLDLKEDADFIKIAYVHTFFKNEFKLDSSFINRSGRVIGRDIEFLTDDVLQQKISSPLLVTELKNEVNSIAKNRLKDFSQPITCNPTPVPKRDFHLINKGDVLDFACQFTTGRFLVDYNKVLRLEDQYINNKCR